MIRVYYLLILLTINTAHALLVEDLYSSEVQVPSKSITQEQKNTLTTQEFTKILKKITGKPKSLSLDNVDKYVSKYEYKDDKLINDKVILKISFDKVLINQTLIENKYVFLDEYRPVTIIWPKTSTVIESDLIQELLQQILVVAKESGLPIVYPIFDLKEVEILHKDILDDNFTDAIKQASKKYGADEIIIAECSTKDDILNINWKSIVNNWQFSDKIVEHNSVNLEQANVFVDKLMEHFVHHYVGNNIKIPKEVVLMKITNVINLEDYVKVEKYLQNLAVTNNLHATKFQAGEVEFEIVAIGGKQAIKNAISTNNLLQENYSNKYPDDNTNTLLYTLQFS